MMVWYLLVFLSHGDLYADEVGRETKVNQQTLNSKPSTLKTEHTFDDFLVQGKFHFSDHTVVTVEEDKVLDGLVGVRKDFKDRIQDLE